MRVLPIVMGLVFVAGCAAEAEKPPSPAPSDSNTAQAEKKNVWDDYEGVRWGSPPSAAPGLVRDGGGSWQFFKAPDPHFGTVKVHEVNYIFDEKKGLFSVLVTAKGDEQMKALVSELFSRYGQPNSGESSWRGQTSQGKGVGVIVARDKGLGLPFSSDEKTYKATFMWLGIKD